MRESAPLLQPDTSPAKPKPGSAPPTSAPSEQPAQVASSMPAHRDRETLEKLPGIAWLCQLMRARASLRRENLFQVDGGCVKGVTFREARP